MTEKNTDISDKLVQRTAEVVEFIHPSILCDEPRLIELKHYDYIYMSVLDATSLFLSHYIDCYDQYSKRQAKKTKVSQQRRGVKYTELFWNNNRTITALWKARQSADELGIPYGLFVHFCFETWMAQNKKGLPRPNQLYSESLYLGVIDRWNSYLRERLEFIPTKDQRFKFKSSKQYKLYPEQKRYLKAQFDFIKKHTGDEKYRVACDLIFVRETLPALVLEKLGFDKALVERLWDGNRFEYDDVFVSQPFLRSCFGLYKYSATDACSVCPQVFGCQRASERVSERLIAKTGTDQPLLEQIRQNNRLRKQKEREKKKQHECVTLSS